MGGRLAAPDKRKVFPFEPLSDGKFGGELTKSDRTSEPIENVTDRSNFTFHIPGCVVRVLRLH